MKSVTGSSAAISAWPEVQSKWIYVEAALSGGDIAKSVTHETKASWQISTNWLTVLKKANDTGKVGAVCYRDEGLRELLSDFLDQTQKRQKAQAGSIAKESSFPTILFCFRFGDF
jgi:hypothetical protein